MKGPVLRPVFQRIPIRIRLALVNSGFFLLAGIALLAVINGLVANNLSHSATPPSHPTFPGSCATKVNLSAAQLSICHQMFSAFQNGVSVGTTSQSHVALHQLLDYSLISLWALAGLCALLGWVAAGRALRPVHAIAAAAQQASDENLSVRIALTGPRDEIKYLADTFDAMLERLDAAFSSQRRFVANASHELRTPLAVIRAAIDVTLAKSSPTTTQLTEMAAEVAEAAERAETLIEALLVLARSDRGIERREELDLAVIAEDVIGAAAGRLLGLTVETRLEPGLIPGDLVLVERMISNLVDNAVLYNLPGGWIQLVTGARDGAPFLDVANSGPVITADQMPSLFEPFRRLGNQDSSPDGAGLGLSIVKSVAAAHHGDVRAHPLASGGLEFSVSIPDGMP